MLVFGENVLDALPRAAETEPVTATGQDASGGDGQEHGVSEPTLDARHRQCGQLAPADVKRLRQLEHTKSGG